MQISTGGICQTDFVKRSPKTQQMRAEMKNWDWKKLKALRSEKKLLEKTDRI